MEYKYKLDSKQCIVATGTVGGNIRPFEYAPDESYDEIIGIELYQNNAGGTTNGYYQISISDQDKAYVELSHKGVLLTSEDVDQRGKMRPVNIPIIKNRKIKIGIMFDDADTLTADLDIEIVFTLRKAVIQTK